MACEVICENCEECDHLSDDRLFCPVKKINVDGEDTCNDGYWIQDEKDE